MTSTTNVGMHLIMDARNIGNDNKLCQLSVVKSWANAVIAATKMKARNWIIDVLDKDDETEPGISIIVEIATSHIAIHTWPEKGRLNADVFSCKPFDEAKVVELLENHFDVECTQSLVLHRT